MIRPLALWLALAGPATAVTCQDITFEALSFTACTVDAASEDLRLFHSNDTGAVLGSFGAVEAGLAGKSLPFAMNAGMFHSDRAPVGLYVQDGVQTAPLQPNAGPGNFGLLPNGVLCLTDGTAAVYETQAYLDQAPVCRDATQSGPMLVIDGALHPRFIEGGASRFIRNGVGTSADTKTAVFVVSNQPVNFHTFARVFRDRLGLDQALYFDGKVSRLHAPSLGRSDAGFPMGPMVAVID